MHEVAVNASDIKALVTIHFVLEVACKQMRMVAIHVLKLSVVAAFESKASISVPAKILAFNTFA